MDGQPGDKSPGYYRLSLRDEVKTGPSGNMAGAKHIPLKPCSSSALKPYSPSGAINRPKSSLTWRHSVQSPKYLLGSEIGVLMQSGLGVNDEESS
jgi:hypothetical protein